MVLFTKESLETLRQRVDLVEVLSSHMDLKAAGASYKGLCPFHDEKTPSFMVQRGDSHYHCFGCGAHGDAIQFLMTHLKMTFTEAIESLAQRFGVHLEKVEGHRGSDGPNKRVLKDALDAACRFYQFMLLHSDEGRAALEYLFQRGIDLDFIKRFRVGLAPKQMGLFRQTMEAQAIKKEVLVAAGLAVEKEGGRLRDFFYDRITFPVCDGFGGVIGFSARKYREETFGGKYVNTPDTVLFKKFRVLFGLHHSRRRIAKERRAIVVEGQVDALRLIQAGFDITVAGQGTAFGDGHVQELVNLGVEEVFLALDGDSAGLEGAAKIGHLFQKVGVEVRVVKMLPGQDPDTYLREQGPDAFRELIEGGDDYLTFLVGFCRRDINVNSPAGKNALIARISKQVRSWDSEVMVHESLRKLAQLTGIPEEMVGVGQQQVRTVYVRPSESAGLSAINPDRILESDLLRWLVLLGESRQELVDLVSANISSDHLCDRACRHLYGVYLEAVRDGRSRDMVSLVNDVDDAEARDLLNELLQKKVNMERAEQHCRDAVQRLLDRKWMDECEAIRMKISSGQCSDDEALDLVKQFDELKRNAPKIQEVAHSLGDDGEQ